MLNCAMYLIDVVIIMFLDGVVVFNPQGSHRHNSDLALSELQINKPASAGEFTTNS